MMVYNCWKCMEETKSPENKIGQRDLCPKCETPNLVPKPFEVEYDDDLNLCYFCKQRAAEPGSASVVLAKESFLGKPLYRCLECRSSWEETPENTSWEGEDVYKPKCPSCGSNNVVPTDLPAIPVGPPYTLFGFTSYRCSIGLEGYVCVPRCRRCKIIHNIINKFSLLLAFIASSCGIALMILNSGKEPSDDFFEFFSYAIISFLIIGLPVFFLTRIVIGIIIGRVTAPEKKAKTYFATKRLIENGWDQTQMCPGNIADIIRDRLASQKNASTI